MESNTNTAPDFALPLPEPTGLVGTIGGLQSYLRSHLEQHSDSPALDGWVLLAHILQKQKSWVIAHPEYRLNPGEIDQLSMAVARLDRGEPLPYVLGSWEFFGLPFKVTPDVLIPRPETELLVELALDWLREHPHRRLAADLGTGSGCVAVTMAKAIPDLRLTATDRSGQALKIARQNIDAYSLSERVSLVQADLLDPIRGRFDLICANLPYIPTRQLPKLKVYRHEPALALDGGTDGLDLIRRLIKTAPFHLKPGGSMLLEIEADQGKEIRQLAVNTLPDSSVRLIKDIAGRHRTIAIQLPDGN